MSRLRTWLLRLLAGLLVVVAVSLGLTWWGVRHIDHAVTRVPMGLDALGERPSDTAALDILLVLTAPPAASGEPLDWAEAEGGVAHVTVMHIDANHRGMSFVALPTRRVLSAAESGAEALVTTVEAMTNIHLDHVAVLEWSAIAGLISAADGVDLEVPGGVNGWEPGVHRLDAEAAWRFVRDYPDPTSDAPGTARRMQFLLRIVLEDSLHQEMARNPVLVARFLDRVAHGLTLDTEWSLSDLPADAWHMRHLRSYSIRFVVGPTDLGGDAVVQPDADTLWDALRSDTVDTWLGRHPQWETGRRL